MILKNIKAVLFSNVLIQVIGFISSFVVRRIIEPSVMGVWNLVTIVTNYIQMFTLGTNSASSREMPYYLGQENYDMEKKVRETFFFMTFAEVLFSSLIFYLYFFMKGDYFSKAFWYLYLLAPFYALTTRIYNAIITVLQSRQKFVELSKQNVYISLSGIILIIAGALLGNIVGLFIGYVILYSYRIFLNYILVKKIGIKFSIGFHPKVFKQLFKIGFPMDIAGYIWSFFVNIDSLLVAKIFGVKELAFYALGVSFYKQLSDFPTQVNTIFYPRIMQKFGKYNSLHEIKQDVFSFITGNLLVLEPFLCLAGCFFLPWMIRTFINNYSPAIYPARILLFAIFFIPQVGILLNIFVLKKQMGKLIVFHGLALVVTLSSICLFNYLNHSLIYVAYATVLGYAIFFISVLLFSKDVLTLYEKNKILGLQFLSITGTIIVFIVLEHIFPQQTSKLIDTLYTLIKILISFVICLPIAIWGLKISNAWEKVKEEMNNTFSNIKIKIKSFIPDSNQ